MTLQDRHIVRLFSRMAHLYGHRWASTYGDAMSGNGLSPSAKQWLYDLRDYSPEQVAVGLAAVVEKRLSWPPGPIEFMDLCDGLPTLTEVLDRENDYGPICKAIRSRMDWYSLESMPSSQVLKAATERFERTRVSLRKSGALRSLQALPSAGVMAVLQ